MSATHTRQNTDRMKGERAAHDAVLAAIERTLVDGPRTRDLGGTARTDEVGQAIAAALGG